jgi:hypothetical protein
MAGLPKVYPRRQRAAVPPAIFPFIPLIVLIALSGCSAVQPECQKDTAFYLRETVFDCQTYEGADASKGVQP